MVDKIPKEHNYGIDILRILAMFMIVLLHTMGHGGLLDNVQIGTVQYSVAWLLEVIAFSAVNLYGLISGFVGINSNFKYTRLIKLWLQVFFYSVSITGIFFLYKPEVITTKVIIDSFFPILRTQYWYVTSYFGMAFFLPYINPALNKCTKETAIKVILTVLVFYVSIPCLLAHSDPFLLNYGFSAIWLLILYFIGAFFQKFQFYKTFSKTKVISTFLSLVLLTWISKMAIAQLSNRILGQDVGSQLLILYVSPTIFLASLILFSFFAKIKVKNGLFIRLIKSLSPATLGVYLISDNALIRENFIKGSTRNFFDYNICMLLAKTLGIVFLIYIACSLIDIIRNRVFSLIHLDKEINALYSLIKKISSNIITLIDIKTSV